VNFRNSKLFSVLCRSRRHQGALRKLLGGARCPRQLPVHLFRRLPLPGAHQAHGGDCGRETDHSTHVAPFLLRVGFGHAAESGFDAWVCWFWWYGEWKFKLVFKNGFSRLKHHSDGLDTFIFEGCHEEVRRSGHVQPVYSGQQYGR